MDKHNVFIVVGASRSNLSDAALRKCMEETRNRATRDRMHPMRADEAKRILELLPECESILFGRERKLERAQHEQAFRDLVDEKRKAALEKIDLFIRFSMEHGYYTETNLTRLKDEVNGILSEEDIRARLNASGLSDRREPKKAELKAKKGLDPEIAKQISKGLQNAGKESLYDLLGIGHTASNKEAVRRKDELYQRLRQSGKTDAVTSAMLKLLGHANAIFGDPVKRQQYDTTLARTKFETFSFELMIEAAVRDHILSFAALRNLLKDAAKHGVAKDDAHGFIHEHCGRRKIRVMDTAGNENALDFIVCGSCNSPARDRDQEKCAHCGRGLHFKCPKCRERLATDQRACHQCGFESGDYVELRKDLDCIRDHLANRRFAKAREHLSTARRFGDGWPELTLLDSNIATAEIPYKEAHDKVQLLRRNRRLMEAHSVLAGLTLPPSPDIDFRRAAQEVEADIQRAKALMEQAGQEERRQNTEAALGLIEDAQALVSDFPGIMNAAKRMAPPPPANVRAEQTASAIHLRWAPPSGRRPAYLIIRKEGGRPRDPGDGVEVGATPNKSFDDQKAPFGKVLYYAIFSDRAGILSVQGANVGPVLRFEAVKDLSAFTEDRALRLAWRAPVGATAVQVWRRDGSPPEVPIDGIQIDGATLSGLRDSPLTNYRGYGYLVVPIYPDPVRPGREMLGLPQRIRATAEPPPPPIVDLLATFNEGALILKWTPVKNARGHHLDVAFLLAPVDGDLPSPASLLAVTELERIGPELKRDGTGSTKLRLSQRGRFWIVPCVINGSSATVGKPVQINTLSRPEALTARVQGPYVHIEWNWLEGVSTARILWHRERFELNPGATNAVCVDISRAEYMAAGCVTLIPHGDHDIFVTAFTGSERGDFSSPGQLLVRRQAEVRVFYEVEMSRGWRFRKPSDVTVSVWSRTRVDLPSLKLVVKHGRSPLAPNDGEVIHQTEARTLLADERLPIPVLQQYWGHNFHAKLFLADNGASEGIRLLPSASDKLRLG